MVYNLSKSAAGLRMPVPKGTPKRIKDRNINWKETYREKSDDLKHRFEKLIGPGSYFRWEGKDNYTNSDYFIVVGPAITKDGKKQWFAGIKKLPPEHQEKHFAPSGEYFSTMMGATSYASERWGLNPPKGIPNYDQGTLDQVDIPRHVKG